MALQARFLRFRCLGEGGSQLTGMDLKEACKSFWTAPLQVPRLLSAKPGMFRTCEPGTVEPGSPAEKAFLVLAVARILEVPPYRCAREHYHIAICFLIPAGRWDSKAVRSGEPYLCL